jgi:hypothetical protein
MEPRTPIKRISVMVGERQYERMIKGGLNISAFIRDLIEDHFSAHVISLSVSPKTHDLYMKVISNTGATDEDLEPLFVKVLKELLEARIQKIKVLQSELEQNQ